MGGIGGKRGRGGGRGEGAGWHRRGREGGAVVKRGAREFIRNERERRTEREKNYLLSRIGITVKLYYEPAVINDYHRWFML